MKKILCFVAILLVAASVQATVWRVNNLPGADADYATLQAAHNSVYVAPGDTFYLEASSGSYGDLTATKKFIIIGAGYFLAENLDKQANINSSIVGNITFNAGSDGSFISGCTIGKITINASNLVIEKNYIVTDAQYELISFNGNTNNTFIRQNYIVNYKNNSSTWSIKCNATANNVLIEGNYIWIDNNPYCKAIEVQSNFSGEISNNIIVGNTIVNNVVFNNNILLTGTFTQTNTSYNNNLCADTQFGNSNGNQQYVILANLFVGATGNSTDGQWQLKTGSPALGAGMGGIDCGMFAGDYPYKLSGLPTIPSIYYHEQIIDNVNQQLNVTIKAKSNN